MPNSSEEELINTLRCELNTGNGGPSLWQVQKYFNENKFQLGIDEILQLAESELKKTFSQENALKYNLKYKADGTSIKATYKTILGKDGPQGGGFGMNINSLLKNPFEMELAIQKMSELLINSALKFQPTNQDLNITVKASPPGLKEKIIQILEKKLFHFAAKFQDKGINVFLNGKLLVGPPYKAGNEMEESHLRKLKPWDVPHGAPDKKPK